MYLDSDLIGLALNFAFSDTTAVFIFIYLFFMPNRIRNSPLLSYLVMDLMKKQTNNKQLSKGQT